MKPLVLVLTLLLLAGTCAAATQYIVTNNNSMPNSASVFTLDEASGTLTEVATLESSGNGWPATFPAPVNVSVAINSSGTCVYIANFGSDDISAFSKALNYKEVGAYRNSNVGYNGELGGSLALTPNGRYLYATYSGGSGNVGAWSVNADCSLTFIAAYVPSIGSGAFADLQVTPNGSFLVLPLGIYAELFAIDTNSGELVDKGYLSFHSLTGCQGGGCGFIGLDITKDSKVVLFAGSANGKPAVFLAQITSNGLINPRRVDVNNPEHVTGPEMLVLSKAAYMGSGPLYITCNAGAGFPGIITANFTENPPGLALVNATQVQTTTLAGIGPLAAIGNLLVLTNVPSTLQVYSINPDGSVALASSVADSLATYPYSIVATPNNR
jgi:hypothetical protein